MHELIENMSKMKVGVEEKRGMSDQVASNLEILRQNLMSSKEEAEQMQFTSFDGTLVWRITEVAEKLSM